MHINDEHLYHGAALIQIAENHQFTAINQLKVQGEVVSVAYRINSDIAVYLKYGAYPKSNKYAEYQFTFKKEQLANIRQIWKESPKTYIALVCIKDREICCISCEKLIELIKRRSDKKGSEEAQYTVLVTVQQKKSFRVYVNAPGKKKTILGKEFIVKRNEFPDAIFS